ncbi:pip5k3, partial [Symbiodinium sp. KB8]
MASSEVVAWFDKVEAAVQKHPKRVGKVNGIIKFVISGSSEWVIDVKNQPGSVRQVSAEARAGSVTLVQLRSCPSHRSQGTVDDADATVTYTSEKAFVDIVTGRMNLVNAYFKQKFVAEGNTKLLEKLTKVMDSIAKEEKAAAAAQRSHTAAVAARARAPSYALGGEGEGGDWQEGETASTGGMGAWARSAVSSLFGGGGGGEGGRLDRVPHMGEASPASPTQGQWLPDHLVKHCMMCSVGFSIFQRKHHCRMCGGIYCSECSTHKLEGQRICDLCYERAHNL